MSKNNSVDKNGWRRFEGIETGQLIELFQNPNSEGSTLDDTFLAICFRFRKDLLKACIVICKNRGYDKDAAIALCERVFKKYGRTRKFNPKKGNKESIDKSFIAYLYIIAKNDLNDYYKYLEKKKKGLTYTGDEKLIKKLPDIDADKLFYEDKIIHQTISQLPFSHQIIYLNYTLYEKEGVRLPRKLLLQMRTFLGGISQNSVRCYKREAIKEIEKTKDIIKMIKNGNNG